jgi:hypothetical protein
VRKVLLAFTSASAFSLSGGELPQKAPQFGSLTGPDVPYTVDEMHGVGRDSSPARRSDVLPDMWSVSG